MRRISTWFLVLLLTVLAVCLHTKHYLNSDEGVVLQGAWRIYGGELPYRDFFSYHVPGSYYLVRFLWAVSGPSYTAARALAVAALLMSALGLYAIARSLGHGRATWLPPLILVSMSAAWPIINHNLFSSLCAIWATQLLLLAWASPTRRVLLVICGGLLAGVSTLFLLHRGILLSSALLALLMLGAWSARWRRPARLGFAFMLSAALPLCALLPLAPVKVLYQQLVIFPLFNYYEVNRLSPLPLILVAAVLCVTYLLLRGLRDVRVSALLLLQCALLVGAATRSDYYHVTVVLFPLLALAPALLQRAFEGGLAVKMMTLAIVLCAGVTLIPTAALVLVHQPPFVSWKDKELFATITERCGDTPALYAGPFLPGLYFELRKQNPTPYDFLYTHHNTEAQFAEAEALLQRAPPACVVMKYGTVAKFGHSRDNAIDRFLDQHYEQVYEEEGYLLLTRREP